MHLTYLTLNMSISMHKSTYYLMTLIKAHIPVHITMELLLFFHLKNDLAQTQVKIGICVDFIAYLNC